MRLEILRTAQPEQAGGTHFVVDNDAPGAQVYNPVYVGSLVECAEYVTATEQGEPVKPRFAIRDAQHVGSGERIANVGEILRTRTEGAFVHLTVRTDRWDAATGTPVRVFDFLFLHCTDELVMEV